MQFSLTEKDPVLFIEGNAEIVSKDGSVILCEAETCTIKSDGGYVLLWCRDELQPVIGEQTFTGMSGGRWSPALQCRLKHLILDNVHLTLRSTEPHFAIGAYGYRGYPKITLKNGVTLIGPDYSRVGQQRYLMYKPSAHSGSTKLSGRCEYVMSLPGEERERSWHAQQKLEYKHVPVDSKFQDPEVHEPVVKKIDEALQTRPDWLGVIEADEKSTCIHKAEFWRLASKIPVDITTVLDALDDAYNWSDNLIGELSLCSALSNLYIKWKQLPVTYLSVFDLADDIVMYVQPEDVEKASDSEIEFFWGLISPLNYKDWHHENKRVDCMSYFGRK